MKCPQCGRKLKTKQQKAADVERVKLWRARQKARIAELEALVQSQTKGPQP